MDPAAPYAPSIRRALALPKVVIMPKLPPLLLRHFCWAFCLPLVLLLGAGLRESCAQSNTGELEIRAVDATTGEPLAVRMHLKDQKGKTVKPPKVPFWNDHFVFHGIIILKLPVGNYTFEMERGPEYKFRSGYFTIDRGATDNKTVEMHRFIDMKKEGWWSGDLSVYRPAADMDLLMRAEDLHLAVVSPPPAATASKNAPEAAPREMKIETFGEDRIVAYTGQIDARSTGALLSIDAKETAVFPKENSEYPSALSLARQLEESGSTTLLAESATSWDLPVWVASGTLDGILVAGPHLIRDPLTAGKWQPAGKPLDTLLYPGRQGSGRWASMAYYHLLNCGLRIPPAAGSGTGKSPNPLGYSRVYVHCGEKFTYESWWENFRKGRCIITNGPMIQPKVNGQLPGHVFTAEQGETVALKISLNLSTREKIEYLEVVKDGKVEHEVRLDEWAAAGGKLPDIEFQKSGWLAIRAVTSNPDAYRFASTGPYYVEIGYQPRISKTSSQFMLDWVVERAKQLKFATPEERESVIVEHRAARDFWTKKVETATDE